MATEEIKIVVKQEGAQEAANQVNALNNALENTEQAAQNASQGASKASTSFTEMFDSFNEGMDAFSNVSSQIQAAFQEFNRQSGIMRNFTGTITETSQRMQGLVSNIQLMESANRIAATGLQLTDHQFGNLTVAAQRYAQATGQDLTQSMEQLSEAISEGSAEQLQRFGLELGNATGKAEIQEAALGSLEQQYGELEAAGNGVTDVFTRMQVASENTTTSFIEGVNSAGTLNTSIDRLKNSASELVGVFGVDLPEGFDLAKEAGSALSHGISIIIRQYSHYIDAIKSAASGDLREALNSLGSALNFNQAFADEAIDEAVSSVQETIRRNQRIISQSTQQATEAQEEHHTAVRRTSEEIRTQGQLMQDLISRINSASQSQSIFNQIVQEGLNAEDTLRQVNFEKERTRQQALAEADRRINDKELEYKRNNEDIIKQKVVDAEEEFQRRRMSNLQTYGSEFSNIVGATIQAGIDGEMKFGKAMRHVIDQWLKKFAIQETLKGASDLASAIGSTIINPPAAATLYASSGKHFAIAAAAGAASLAIPGGKGGGGKGSGAGESGAGPTPSNVPSAPTGRQEPTGVVINVNGMTGATEAQIGRAYENAIRAAQSRY